MFSILADTDFFILVYKAPNCNFHAEDGEAGLMAEVQAYLGYKIFSVHRLDKITSGLVLFAKNRDLARDLGELFRQRQVEKYYLAISASKPKKKQGTIEGDISKGRRGSYKLLKTLENPAVTQFFSYSLIPGYRLFLVKPHTGKTHQIRVALKSVGAPILGDTAYGAPESDRGYLHAYHLSFELYGEHYSYTCAPRAGKFFLAPECIQFLTTIEEKGGPSALAWPKVKGQHGIN